MHPNALLEIQNLDFDIRQQMKILEYDLINIFTPSMLISEHRIVLWSFQHLRKGRGGAAIHEYTLIKILSQWVGSVLT